MSSRRRRGRPGVVLVHDVAGLTPESAGWPQPRHVRLRVVAPDFLSSHGGAASFRGNAAEVRKAVEPHRRWRRRTRVERARLCQDPRRIRRPRPRTPRRRVGRTHVLLFAAGRAEAAACVALSPDPHRRSGAAENRRSGTRHLRRDDPATSAPFSDSSSGGVRQAAARREGLPRCRRGFHDPGEAKITSGCRQRGLDTGGPASRRVQQGAAAPNEHGVEEYMERCLEIVGRLASRYGWWVPGSAHGRCTSLPAPRSGRPSGTRSTQRSRRPSARPSTTWCVRAATEGVNGRDGAVRAGACGAGLCRKWDLQSLNKLTPDEDAHAAQPARHPHRRGVSERWPTSSKETRPRRRPAARRRRQGVVNHVHHAARRRQGGGNAGNHPDRQPWCRWWAACRTAALAGC